MNRYGQLARKDITTDARRLRPLLAALGGVDTYKVAVSADDTTPNYLENKLASADTSVVITATDDGADEGLDFSVAVYVAGEISDHADDADAHHNQVHVLASTSGLGADHTTSGLTAGMVLRASAADDAAFAVLQHDDLGGVGADDHHSQVHVLASTSGLGADHTVSGLTAGQVLRATGATTAAFASLQAGDLPAHVLATNLALGGQHSISGASAGDVLRASGAAAANFQPLAHSDLSGVGADDHHAQVHTITGSDHTVTGSQWQVVGLTGTNTLGLLDSSDSVTAATAAILRTSADGWVTILGVGIGSAEGADNAIIMPDDGIIGFNGGGLIRFDNQATDQIEFANANVLVNATTTDSNAINTPKFYVEDGTIAISQDGDGAFADLYSYGTDSGDFPAIRMRRGRGSRGTPGNVSSADILGRFGAGGYGAGFANESGAYVQVVAAENWDASNQGAEVQIHTTPTGSTTSEKRFVVAANGDVYQYGDGPVKHYASLGSNSATNYDVDFPDVSTANANLRLFRATNTSGTKTFTIYRGNASSTADHTFTANGGYQAGSPTGGDNGVGSINVAADVYKNNSAFTNPDYALESWRDGRIVLHANKPGARNYRRLTLAEVEGYIRANLRLPGVTGKPAGLFERGDFLLEKVEELFTHVIELNHKVEALYA